MSAPVSGDSIKVDVRASNSDPSLESWAAAKSALDDTKEGEAIQVALNEVAECADNRFYASAAS